MLIEWLPPPLLIRICRSVLGRRDVVLPPLEYFVQQTLLVHPLAAPIWITGVIALFTWRQLKPYRALGWSYVVSYAFFFAMHGKNYYLSTIYPMLLAAGAVVIETAVSRPRLVWMKPSVVMLLLATGAFLAPVVVPVLRPDLFIAYTKRLPFKLPVLEYAHARAVLPQWYADQFGGLKSWRRPRLPTIGSIRRSAAIAASSPRIMDKPAPSTSLAAATACLRL